MASDNPDMDSLKFGYCSRHDVSLPCRFCNLERYVLQQQQQQQELKRQEEERQQQFRPPRPGPRHEKLQQQQQSIPQCTMPQPMATPFLPQFDPQLLQQQIQQQLELQIQQQLQQQLMQLQPRPPATLQQPQQPPKMLLVIQDPEKERTSNTQMYSSSSSGYQDQMNRRKGRNNPPTWQQTLERQQTQPNQLGQNRAQALQSMQMLRQGQRLQQDPTGFSSNMMGLRDDDTQQKVLFLQQQLQQQQMLLQQQQQQQQQQSILSQPNAQPKVPSKPYPLDARQIQELQELRNKVQEMKMAQMLKAQGQDVADTAAGRGQLVAGPRAGDIVVLSEPCNYCHQADHTNAQCPISLQSALNSVKSSEQKVRLMIEVAESIIHHRSVGVHALIMHEWRGRQSIEQRAAATHLERYLVLTFGMESIVRAHIVAQEAAQFGQLMEQYMSCRCPSWDQWVSELKDIQAMAKSGRPSPHQGRQLQVLEAFIQSIFHDILLLPGGASRWPLDSLDRAVARALHLAICKVGDHAGYGVTCAYCAALLRCISSEQVHRDSLGKLPWNSVNHPRYPMPFRATARAAALSIHKASPVTISEGLVVNVLEYLSPFEVPGVVDPLDGPYNSLGCAPRYYPGPRRCLGTYHCPCGAAWRSAHTWAGRGQGCIACGQLVDATSYDPLWLRSAIVDIPASYPNCVVVASSPIAISMAFPFIDEEADLDVFHRFDPKPLIRHLHSDLELEAQLVYASGHDATEARKAYECEYYLCGSDIAFLLPGLDNACTLHLARVPEGVTKETIVQDFSHLARLGAEDCVPEIQFASYSTPGYKTAIITFPDASMAAEVFFQYHCQLDETTELADCSVCQELGFSCTLQLQLYGTGASNQLTLRGIPPYMPVEEISEIFAQFGHPPTQVVRNPNIHRVATVDFETSEEAKSAYDAFHRFIAEHTQPKTSA